MSESQASTNNANYVTAVLHKAALQHQRKGFTPMALVGEPWAPSTELDCRQFVIRLISGKEFDVFIQERE